MLTKIKDVNKQSLFYVLKQLNYRYYIGIILIAIAIVFGTIYIFRAPESAEAQWWNITWSYRQSIAVTNSSGSELTDFQIQILDDEDLSSLVSVGKLESDLSDLRFTDSNNRVLDYWIEDNTNSSVDVWIKVPSIPTDGTTIYMYYGNSSASDESSTSWMPQGGTMTTIDDGIVYAFTADGNFSNSINSTFDVLVVGGGGGAGRGSNNGGGGGGAGGLVFEEDMSLNGNFNIVVGSGGDGKSPGEGGGDNGENSVLGNDFIVALGGGGGGSYRGDNELPNDGGSGGGGRGSGVAPGNELQTISAWGGFGNDGGPAPISGNVSGGSAGGGAGGVGEGAITAAEPGADGGVGLYYGDIFSDSFGDSGWFAGGGAGNSGTSGTTGGLGGNGGGGDGGGVSGIDIGEDGLANTGGGGGAGHSGASGSGGSGVVLIKYPSSNFPVTIGSPSSEENAPGPIGYWNFDEGYGSTAYDSTGYKNDGTITGATWIKNGKKGGALSFDGNDDYLDLGNDESLKIISPMTISAWVKIDSYHSDTNVGQVIAASYNSWTGYTFYLKGVGAKLGFRLHKPSTSTSIESTEDLEIGKWYHVVGTYDGANAKIYTNAVEKNSKIFSDAVARSALIIGKASWSDNNYFDGSIDEVIIYDKALSEDEIKQLYNTNAGSFNMGNSSNYYGPVNTGDGSDGTLTVTSADTVVNTYAYLTANEASGQTVITVNSSSGFSSGDEVMILQTQDSANSNAGKYEFAKISSINSNDITLTSGISNSYYSGTFNNTAAESAQIIRIPQYAGVTVESGASITATPWDGYKGGIVIFRSTGNVEIKSGGSIDVKGDGYRGGRYSGYDGYSGSDGECGESYTGRGVPGFYNGNTPITKDGGGTTYVNGSGGSYRTAGEFADPYGGYQSLPGEIYGDNPLNKIYLGSGGGGGHNNAGNPVGGAGGGVVFVEANNINIIGDINSSGEDGWFYLDNQGHWGAGGGSGGSITLRASRLDISSNILSVDGGSGLDGYNAGGHGADGGEGRMVLEAHTLNGNIDEFAYTGLPVLDMSFESQSGSTTYDASGYENNGTISGATWTGSEFCKEGRCFEFNGTSDYIDLGEGNGDFDLDDVFTIGAWIKLDSYDWSPIVCKRNSGSFAYSVRVNGSNKFSFLPTIGGAVDGEVVPLDTWTYVTAVFNNGNVDLYQNGVLTATASGRSITNNDINVFVGSRESQEEFFDGKIDQVKIFDRALTQREIMMEMNNGKPGPVLDMNFNESGGDTAYDKSIYENNGTLTNSPTWQTADNCVSGSCLKFNNNARVDLGSTILETDNDNHELTLMAWINSSDFEDENWIISQYNATSKRFIWNTHLDKRMRYFVGGNSVFGNTVMNENQWYFVVVTKNSVGVINMYIDGILDGTGTLNSSFADVNTIIGNPSATPYDFDGKIDEIKIYPYALTEQEIKQEYIQSQGQFGQTNAVGTKNNPGASCADILARKTNAPDGRYWIDPSGGSISDEFEVYCDMTTNGGGWTLVTNIIDTSANNIPDTVTAVRAGWSETSDGVLTSSFEGDQGLGYFVGTTILDKFDPESIKICALKNKNDKRCYSDNLSTSDFTYDGYGGGTGVSSSNNFVQMAAALSGTVAYGDTVNGAHGKFVTDDLSLFKGDSYSGGGYIQQWSGDAANWHVWGYGITQTNSYTNDQEIYNHGNSDSGQLRAYTAGWEVWLKDVATTTVSYEPILDMDFDQYSGGLYLDKSGNGYNGTPSGDPAWTGSEFCKKGRCLELDGDDYVDLGNVTALNPALNEFTISVWAQGDSSMDSTGMILSKGNSGQAGYGVWLSSGNQPNVDYCDGTTRTTVSYGTGYNDNIWHHYVSIHKDDGKTYLYIDGIYRAVSFYSITASLESTHHFYIGQNYNSGQRFKGLIDEVKVYNRALTQAEISELYNGGAPIGHWRLDEGEAGLCAGGADVCDSSGEGNHGTISSSPVWITDTSQCKQGGCMDFDGVDDFISMGSVHNYGDTGQISLSIWFRPDDITSLQSLIGKSRYPYATYGYALAIQNNYLRGASGNAIDDDDFYTNLTYDLTGRINEWVHAVVTFNNDTNDAYLYVDGELVNSYNSTQTSLSNSRYFALGAAVRSSDQSYFFDGQLDDARIYNYILSEEQVSEIYNGGLIKFK